MKKRVLFVILSVLLIAACAATLFLSTGCSSEEKTESIKAISGNDGTITLSANRTGNKVDVTVRLTKNCGIYQMLLTLSYDTKVLTLTGLDKGSALSSLNFMTTNTATEKGYSITPFKFDYLNADSNDQSTGTMFTLHFSIKKNTGKKTAVGFTYNTGDIKSLTANGLVSRAFAITPVQISVS